MPQAPFPFHKTLDAVAAQPAVNEGQMRDRAPLRLAAHAENSLCLGPPGLGNPQLAVALGMGAIRQGRSVLGDALPDRLRQLPLDAQADRLNQRLQA